ncbi:hypothetical protein Tsubulata_049399 [Turnera subulata]|uniref:Uncharacterized protein n=1 Tax=Turnera subulata TaxID=218843 RepID=A0A9Q0F7F7_9ROSI|nr:hypothetical protein Tsubulata_049399 [Turnera subulata]
MWQRDIFILQAESFHLLRKTDIGSQFDGILLAILKCISHHNCTILRSHTLTFLVSGFCFYNS